ncbi:MAG: ATP-binding protein [Bacteroidetes bacterium]|nr:MAG: ATP-binding protein [Bacteroidota bacterium]
MLRPRQLFPAIQAHLAQKAYTIITGARQVGKTSLLRLLYQQLTQAGEAVFYLSLEDPRVKAATSEHPDRLLQFMAKRPEPIWEQTQEKPIYLLLDEVQYAQDPSHLLKYLYDRYEQNLKIVATGSSAFYIDRKFQDSLAGRKRIFELYPLSFTELLEFRDLPDLVAEVNLMRSRADFMSPSIERLTGLFYEYLTYGGYPAVVMEDDPTGKQFLLEELKNAYVRRDILESGVDKEPKFYLLLQLLADQTGGQINKQELANTAGLDSKTVDHYIYILQKCYHIQIVRPFFRNIRKELTKMPKVYFNDLGMRNALLNRFPLIQDRPDKGQLLENYFFLRLRGSYPAEQIRFWRTSLQQEVDFVIEEQFGKGKAFEIKWNAAAFSPGKYSAFTEAYPGFSLDCLSAQDFYRF